MPQSFWNVLFEVDDRDSQWRRELDNHYHAQMLLTEVRQFTGYTQELVKVQSGMIAENWGEQKAILNGIHAEVAAVREEVGGVRAEVVGMRQEVRRLSVLNERMVEGIAELNATHRQIASELVNTNRALARIAEALENPLGTKARELRREACHWLAVARALPFGRAGQHYADATRLLEKVVENSIGRQDYIAWFELGWLRWKHADNPADAMEAFERAYNLSGAKGDVFYARQSLRHAAYMQSKCDDLESALENTRQWKGAGSPGDAPFDAARYAAKLKRWDVADELLDRAIDLNPSCYLAMLADDDLVGAPIIADLVERKCVQARERLASSKAEAKELQRRLRADAVHFELDDMDFAFKRTEDIINAGEGVLPDDFFQLSSALLRVNAWTSRAQRAFVNAEAKLFGRLQSDLSWAKEDYSKLSQSARNLNAKRWERLAVEIEALPRAPKGIDAAVAAIEKVRQVEAEIKSLRDAPSLRLKFRAFVFCWGLVGLATGMVVFRDLSRSVCLAVVLIAVYGLQHYVRSLKKVT